jgi:hypothetical protein
MSKLNEDDTKRLEELINQSKKCLEWLDNISRKNYKLLMDTMPNDTGRGALIKAVNDASDILFFDA